MSNEKMREEFEAWAQGVLGWEEDEFRLANDGGYYWGATGEAWIVWVASREALLIDLPEGQSLFQRMYGVSCQRPLLIERKQAVNAIESAGLKVKP